VFLLDEPLSNLDAALRSQLRAELIELHRRLGKTMIYVTHDQLEAMTMSTRIAVMQGGVLQQFAPPDEIYNRPANAFVAGFIGTPAMALLPGSLGAADGRMVVHVGALAIEMPCAADAAAPRAVTVGIRPEDVLVGEGACSAKVRLVEPTGHETILALDAGGLALTARMAGGPRVGVGETVAFDLRRERLHLFDTATGQRWEPNGA
jgi:multiple sugar transport system ATP-binding protein